jgi:hypothetical protein
MLRKTAWLWLIVSIVPSMASAQGNCDAARMTQLKALGLSSQQINQICGIFSGDVRPPPGSKGALPIVTQRGIEVKVVRASDEISRGRSRRFNLEAVLTNKTSQTLQLFAYGVISASSDVGGQYDTANGVANVVQGMPHCRLVGTFNVSSCERYVVPTVLEPGESIPIALSLPGRSVNDQPSGACVFRVLLSLGILNGRPTNPWRDRPQELSISVPNIDVC